MWDESQNMVGLKRMGGVFLVIEFLQKVCQSVITSPPLQALSNTDTG